MSSAGLHRATAVPAMGTITGPGLMWKDLSIQTIEAYLALPDAQRRIDFVRSNCLEGLPANVITNPERVNIVLDLYYYTLQFGIEQAFTFDKLSALFSIMKATFLESMAQFLPAKAAFNYFRDLLLQHSVQRPPYSVGLFALQDVTAITEFASRSFFRHYMLYKYCFTKKTEMTFSSIYTYTLTATADPLAVDPPVGPPGLPDGFLQPLSEAEDEPTKLKREEEAALAAVQEPGNVEVTAEDLEKANVPADMQAEVLAQVNEQIVQMKAKMEADMEKQRQEMETRIAALQAQVRGQ